MTTIEKRSYGKTGERVTVLGLGGAYLDRQSYPDGVATVRRALELGMTYFDTSPMYCRGASQAILGEALEKRSEPHLLATKLGYLATPAGFRSPDALRSQFEDNLRLLRRDRVDTLQVHEADLHCWWSDDAPHDGYIRHNHDYDFANAPVMQVLREAKAEGRCRFIGITGNSADNMARILRHVEVDTFLVAFNYSLIWRGIRREALPVARRKGVALILGGTLQGGLLTHVHPEWLSSPPEWMTSDIRDRFERLYALQQDSGLSLVTLTIRYLMADPDVTTILLGAATPAEVEESVTAAQQGRLSADLCQAIETMGVS
jgi:aryl-alcohol dehydrogenase-like predicted oxidoreductase